MDSFTYSTLEHVTVLNDTTNTPNKKKLQMLWLKPASIRQQVKSGGGGGGEAVHSLQQRVNHRNTKSCIQFISGVRDFTHHIMNGNTGVIIWCPVQLQIRTNKQFLNHKPHSCQQITHKYPGGHSHKRQFNNTGNAKI